MATGILACRELARLSIPIGLYGHVQTGMPVPTVGPQFASELMKRSTKREDRKQGFQVGKEFGREPRPCLIRG